MKRIALTGPSGAGKGYIANLLIKRGFAVLDTDGVVHELYSGTELPKKIAMLFGSNVLTEEGCVNRKELAAIVFSDKAALATLNATVHGAVKREVAKWLTRQEKAGMAAAFVEAPQLFEAGMETDFDAVVAVVAGKEVRLDRICARDEISKQRATARMDNQMSEEEYSNRCDFTIVNDGICDLQAQIDQLINKHIYSI